MKNSVLTHDKLIEMYCMMYRIRRFELKVNELFLKGLIPGTIHLSHGQEAVAVGAVSCLSKEDRVMLTHRPHGQAIAKGMAPERLMAEILGKLEGCSKGRGGSMHLTDVENGIMPTLPIIGAGIPIAAGIAFAFKNTNKDAVAMSFFGDGTTNIGAFHEGMNLAAIWKLPVVFICENNLYAVSTSIKDTCLLKDLSERAKAYGIPGTTVNGNDVEEVYATVKEAVKRARSGNGPAFVECRTYRHGGHSRTDSGAYRSKEEIREWLEHDPVKYCRKLLLKRGYLCEEECVKFENHEQQLINQAADFAVDGHDPDPHDAFANVLL